LVYVDLECTLEEMEINMEPFSYTYQQYRVFSLAYYVLCSYDNLLSKIDFVAVTIAWFAEEFKNLAPNVESLY